MLNKMKGTYDVLPEETPIWQKLEKTIRNVSRIYHYNEIRTPIIEHSELFHRSVGESSDIVSKETYDFIDRGKRSNTLRPEGTAGVVRSYIENKLYAHPNRVQKLYYIGPMFRYERPQKGRYRQFMQFGAEAFGSESPMLDAELIAYATSILKALKIKDVTVRVNSIGDEESRVAYKEALLNHLKDDITDLCHDCQVRYKTNPLRILDCKVDHDHPLLVSAPKPIDYLNDVSKTHFDNLQKYLDSMDLNYVVDSNLVRGLDYYTHTVFELDANLPTLGAQNTICAGGRYNNLVASLNGPSTPGVGFAFGLERLIYTLESIDFKVDPDMIHLYFMILGDNQKEDGMKMMNRCRLGGLLCDLDYLDRGMKAKWKEASKYNARFVAIYGADEKANDVINIKDQISGEQKTINKHQLYNYIMTELIKPSSSCQDCAEDECDTCQ